MFAVPREQVSRVHASSGTTGQAHRRRLHPRRPRDLGRGDGAVDPRGRRTPGDLVHVAYGYGLFTGGLGAHYGAERLGCTVVPVCGGMTARQVQLILDFEPRVIMVTPSYFLAILDEMEAQGVDPREHLPRDRHLRRRAVDRRDAAWVEQRSGIRAVDIYGLSEVMGPGVSQEALETQDGLHVWEDHFYPRSSTR